ncbi:MAG: hypothetical protein GTN39_05610 [Candidatus Aenigmarchaeota archaeon]|nr:hypothetical protein [Candidatus Aenigmarchaeota archaeon]
MRYIPLFLIASILVISGCLATEQVEDGCDIEIYMDTSWFPGSIGGGSGITRTSPPLKNLDPVLPGRGFVVIDFVPDKEVKFCVVMMNRRYGTNGTYEIDGKTGIKSDAEIEFHTEDGLDEIINLSSGGWVLLKQNETKILNYTVRLPSELEPGDYETKFKALHVAYNEYWYVPATGEGEIIEEIRERDHKIWILVRVPGNQTYPNESVPPKLPI